MLFAVLVFAVLNIRGRKKHKYGGKIVNFLAIIASLRLKTAVLVFTDEDFIRNVTPRIARETCIVVSKYLFIAILLAKIARLTRALK